MEDQRFPVPRAISLLLIFTTVVLHELGHCMAARKYGIEVPRIVILPIGGMAQFSRMPREPRQEFVITAAGPAVNFADRSAYVDCAVL